MRGVVIPHRWSRQAPSACGGCAMIPPPSQVAVTRNPALSRPRQTRTERLAGVVTAAARRTERLGEVQRWITGLERRALVW